MGLNLKYIFFHKLVISVYFHWVSFWKLHLKSTWLKGSQVSVLGTMLFVVRPVSQVECSYGHSPKTLQIIYKNTSRVFFLTSAVLWCVASGLLCSFVCLVWVRCLEFSGGQPLILCVSRDLPNLRHMLGISSTSADTWCHASLHFPGCFSSFTWTLWKMHIKICLLAWGG